MRIVDISTFERLMPDLEEVWIESIRLCQGEMKLLPWHILRLTQSIERYHNAVDFQHQSIEKYINNIAVNYNDGLYKFRMLVGVCKSEIIITCEVVPIIAETLAVKITKQYVWEEALGTIGKCISNLSVINSWSSTNNHNLQDTGLIIDEHGYVKEVLHANVFAVINEQIIMVPTNMQIVNGVYQDRLKVCANIHVKSKQLTITDLQNADAVFLTNAVRGVMPVSEVLGIEKDISRVNILQEIAHLVGF